jgi:hypothetical protein
VEPPLSLTEEATMLMDLDMSLSPKDLTPEGITEWLAQVDQNMQGRVATEKSVPTANSGMTKAR